MEEVFSSIFCEELGTGLCELGVGGRRVGRTVHERPSDDVLGDGHGELLDVSALAMQRRLHV
jgi:hypothetical protein